MRRFNPGNFYCGTTAEWTSCPRPVRHPDHMSGSGSDYWYGESGVVRYSDHWGSEVASCDWYLDGVARCSFDDHDGWRCGFAPWTEFELKTFEVTVYHPDLLPISSSLLRSLATVCRSWSISSSFWAICALMPAGSSAGRYSSASLSTTSRLCLGTTRW